jgi:hypothetical protein
VARQLNGTAALFVNSAAVGKVFVIVSSSMPLSNLWVFCRQRPPAPAKALEINEGGRDT